MPVRSLAQQQLSSTQPSDLLPHGHNDNAILCIVQSSVTSLDPASRSQVSSYFYNLSLIMLIRLQSRDITEVTLIASLLVTIKSFQVQLQTKNNLIVNLE